MKRKLLTLLSLLLLVFSLSAQTPVEVRSMIERYHNLTIPTYSTYPPIPLGEVADAPRGYEPFYISHFGRHGSRYELGSKAQKRLLVTLEKADSLNLLTDVGKQALGYVREAYNKQQGNNGQLSTLGAKQLREMGARTAQNFPEVFRNGGVINARSSDRQRCKDSRENFVKSLCEAYPALKVENSSTEQDMLIMRPLERRDKSLYTEEMADAHRTHARRGDWRKLRKEWGDEQDFTSALRVITHSPEQFLAATKSHSFHFMHRLFSILHFALNFEVGSDEFLSQIYTDEQRYTMYLFSSFANVCYYGSEGHPYMDLRQACMRPLIEDIISYGDKAIKGENGDTVAHLRFSHDTYFIPLVIALGYDGYIPKYMERDIVGAATSVNYSMMIPMGASFQMVFYRNKRGNVLVRTLINERDATLPIKSSTAPFYRWEELREYFQKRMAELDRVSGLVK